MDRSMSGNKDHVENALSALHEARRALDQVRVPSTCQKLLDAAHMSVIVAIERLDVLHHLLEVRNEA